MTHGPSDGYDFPPMWGQMTDEQKHEWFVRERVFRQAIRQDTAFGRQYRDETAHSTDTDDFKVTEELQ